MKIASSGPIFGLFCAETLPKSVFGTARTLCYAWQLPGHSAVFRCFFCKKIYRGRERATRGDTGGAPQARRHGATQAGRHARGEHLARRRHGRRSTHGGRVRSGAPARGKPRAAPGTAVKVARSALIRGNPRGKKILKITLGLLQLERRLIRVNLALSMLQGEGLNFSPLYRGKNVPSQGGRSARGGGRPPGSENVEKTSL